MYTVPAGISIINNSYCIVNRTSGGVEQPMKHSLLTLVLAAVLVMLMTACGGSEDSGPVTVESYKDYSDPALSFSISYPEGWPQSVKVGHQANFYTTSRMSDAFYDYNVVEGETGARIWVTSIEGGEETLPMTIDTLKRMFTDPSVIKSTEETTLNGMPATKITYGFEVAEPFHAERYYVVHDSMITYLDFGVFGNFENYSAVFDKVKSSFKPAERPKAMVADTASSGEPVDSQLVAPPSSTLKTYSGSHFSIGYPDNFEASTSSAGGAMASVMFSGERRDSKYQVDVIDPKGVALEKIGEQFKPSFGGRNPQSASVAGNKALLFSYSPGRGVTRRVYLTISNGKLYRIIMDWFSEQDELYNPVFQKALGTFKAK